MKTPETELAQLRAQLEGMVNGHKQDQKHIEKLEEINTGLWKELDRFRAAYEQLKGEVERLKCVEGENFLLLACNKHQKRERDEWRELYEKVYPFIKRLQRPRYDENETNDYVCESSDAKVAISTLAAYEQLKGTK